MSETEVLSKKFNIDFNLLDEFYDMCFIISSDFEIINYNKAFSKIVNVDGHDIKGENFLNLVENSNRVKVEYFLKECKKDNESKNFITKFNLLNKSYDIDLFVSPAEKDSFDKHKNLFIIARDITEERRKELDLLRFYNIAEKTIFPLVITNLEGNLIYVNPAYLSASGYSKEEVLGKNPNIFGSGRQSKKFWKKMWDTVKSGKVWVGELENRKKNGEPFYTQVLISPFLDSDGNVAGYFGIHRDLHDKKIMEKQLIHTQKMESIGILAAGVAHEVGNPLASISALVQVVQRSSTDEFAKEKLELVKGQITRISKTIRDLVDFSRPSNYELNLTDVNKNIYNAVEIIKAGTKIKDVTFNLNLNKNIPNIPLVEDQIQQVFVNILINAVDAISEQTDKKIEKKISISTDIDEDDITIIFEDTGKGIEEKNLARIFEPFFTTKREGKGTGLGLWITYGIIASFQGTISAESTIGKGTKFIITLPIHLNS